ncbi:hypothetical protein Taro_013762 [Colocasia esculenta]|uniref:Uncharacterized protein n=1 Tax=Colocasia esculenta TaxID=4460 RepID=A0A843UCL6_COLES|nr:hypothetical protein [Colocasia esculenta]
MHLSTDVDRLAKGRRLGFPGDSSLCGSVDMRPESVDRHTFVRSMFVLSVQICRQASVGLSTGTSCQYPIRSVCAGLSTSIFGAIDRVSTFAFASICAFRCPAFAFASSTAFIFASSCAFRYTYLIISLAGSHPPVVDHPDGGPSETNGRRLIALIYSDGRPMKFEPQDTSHHFATEREVADARTTWNKIAANRFTDYLNKHKAAAKKASGNFDDPLMWKGHGPPAIRRYYWDAMCDKWATEDFRHRSRIATENRTKMPEATLHTSGSISFGRQEKNGKTSYEREKCGPVSYKELFEYTHRRKNTGDFVSQKVKEVMETYAKQMVDRHGGDSTQHHEFDAMAWLAATGQPKKGRVFGFGSGLDAGRVISSS